MYCKQPVENKEGSYREHIHTEVHTDTPSRLTHAGHVTPPPQRHGGTPYTIWHYAPRHASTEVRDRFSRAQSKAHSSSCCKNMRGWRLFTQPAMKARIAESPASAKKCSGIAPAAVLQRTRGGGDDRRPRGHTHPCRFPFSRDEPRSALQCAAAFAVVLRDPSPRRVNPPSGNDVRKQWGRGTPTPGTASHVAGKAGAKGRAV